MQARDSVIQTDKVSETMKRAVENTKLRVREIEFQKAEAEREEQELERELLEAQLLDQQKKETAEKGQESERKIAELGER